MNLSMKEEAKIKSKHKRKFLLKFLLQQKLDQTNWTIIAHWPSITFHSLLLQPQGQLGCQMKPNFYGKSNFEVSCTVFQSEVRNLQKCPKYIQKRVKNYTFLKIFQFWLKNSAQNFKNWLSIRIWLHLTP